MALPCFRAGLDGEEEERVHAAAMTLQRWCSRSLKHATSAANSKRRQVSATAISGKRVGPAALDLQIGSSSLILLQLRIFSDIGVAVSGATSPSGLVPGGGSGVHAGKSTTVGDISGIDRVFAHLCGVFYVKARDSVVIFFFLGVLDVLYSHRRYKFMLQVLRAFPVKKTSLRCSRPSSWLRAGT
jgi:hypothetical protein